MFQNTSLIVFLLALVTDVTLACNGYKAKVLKIENCAGDGAIVTIDPDFSVKLNKKCELVPSGCITNKAFNSATIKYKVQKDGMVLKDTKADLCTLAEQASSEAKDMLKLFSIPSKCPVPDEKICANEHKVDLSKYKAMLGMVKGNIITDVEIEHDTGKSCYHIELEISKS